MPVKKSVEGSKSEPEYVSVFTAADANNKVPSRIAVESVMGQRTLHEIHIETFHNSDHQPQNIAEAAHKTTNVSPPNESLNPGSTPTTSHNKSGKTNSNVQQDQPCATLVLDHEKPGVLDDHNNSRETSMSPRDSSRESSYSNDSISLPNSSTARPKSHASIVHFFSGNPMVEVTKGILHLFKENKMTSLSEDFSRSEMICMFGVSAAYTIHDLLGFTASVSSGMEYMRIIRDSTPNQYMVLIKFKNQKLADEFYSAFNNTNFNSIEPDICHLVYVAKIEAMKSTDKAGLPIPGLTELPNCPVCLERMDESVEGILTVLCNHTFHGSCLAQWGDTSCPVCRHCQTPEQGVDNRCFECGSQESLWICLICGYIGCGRYVGSHACRHFQETQHTYAMQLGNNKVWDYVGDNYVHRLVQNKSDGKLVEVDEQGNSAREEKLDSLTLEYTYLLTNQLESQRRYFEEKIGHIEKESRMQVDAVDARCRQISEGWEKMNQNLMDVNKQKNLTERKMTQYHSQLTRVMRELQEERAINKALLENQSAWQKQISDLDSKLKEMLETKDKEIHDLREQLRDMMFHLGAQEQLAQTQQVSQEEIHDGQVIVGAAAPPAPPVRRSRHKKR